MSTFSQQSTLLNTHRYKLLQLFCEYDLGNINTEQLENKLQELNIHKTQAYESFMRKKCGSLKFNEFVKSLTIADDKIVNDMMSTNTNTSCNSPHSHRSRAAGSFNTEAYRYKDGKDFLKWKQSKDIHRNDDDLQINIRNSSNPCTISSPQHSNSKPNALKIITSQINEANHVHFDEETDRNSSNTSIKAYCKLYIRGFINVFDFENRINKTGICLNAAQERIIARLKIDPNVSASELYLTFADAKDQRTGNFNADDAINARREPLIFVDHPSDIITWKNNTNAEIHEMTRRKSFSVPKRGNILTWNQISNEEYNEKVVRKKPPARNAASNSFQSHIVFDGDLVSRNANKQLSSVKRVASKASHFKSTPDLLRWNETQINKDKKDTDNMHKTSWERYRRDSRVPH